MMLIKTPIKLLNLTMMVYNNFGRFIGSIMLDNIEYCNMTFSNVCRLCEMCRHITIAIGTGRVSALDGPITYAWTIVRFYTS